MTHVAKTWEGQDVENTARASRWLNDLEADVAAGGGGGGSSALGSSYLGSYTQAVALLTGSPAALAFDSPADIILGTDIAVSVDGKTFTINTTGWYQVVVDFQFNCAAASAGAVTATLDGSGLDANDLMNFMGPFVLTLAAVPSVRIEGVITTPAFNFTAGGTFQVTAKESLSAGSCQLGAAITVVRIG